VGYITVDDIRSTLPQIRIDDKSRPTEEEVSTLIEVTEAEVNGILTSLAYTSPLVQGDSPLSWKMARQMVKEKVAADVLRIQLAGLRDADALGAKAFEGSYYSKLKRLQDPSDPFDFPDAQTGLGQVKLDVVAESMVTRDPDFFDPGRITRDQVF
jgi:hypothetical protein